MPRKSQLSLSSNQGVPEETRKLTPIDVAIEEKKRLDSGYADNTGAWELFQKGQAIVGKAYINENTGPWKTRIMIGHPVTGNVRIEWAMARFGQTLPCNWSAMDIMQFLSPYVPLKYQVADAENLIAKACIEMKCQWLLFWEHDNIPPNDALIQLNEYMVQGKVPVIGGLYFTKSVPPEPLVYRGIGNSYFDDWRFGDKIWCSGLPFGFTLIHGGIIQAMWDESPEYIVNNQVTRRVFDAPSKAWMDQAKGAYMSIGGTSDLAWCNRVVSGRFFEKAGFPEIQKKKYPFLIDSNIFVHHIDQDGRRFPLEVPKRYAPNGEKREIK